ncbi:PTS sugar transporter subunit IIA [Streptomyces rugosispiralis]|uniref:Ascorbate-specific PTS system EIIA component n=1 Tax=Streptomyces rugosispiralis TaxID=2967341 RepID=A0ABT1UQJ2_9ACTN|nr:PTS sugar transporter subunit IIA [Streptomyces rugosispiralis]MCQ8187327.1 PTS sugar transporter subunit IIA [Streptomyces rugosispiralis]
MEDLKDLLPVEAVRLDVRAADWRAAIGAAGRLMVETGATTDEYTREMVANVEENGPYIVIAPGVAFAHSRPSPAVLSTGMSWVRLTEPVEFGHESNDPVTLVVALAAQDSAAHTSAMASLARLLGDPDTAAALAAAPTPETLHAVLAGERPADGPGPEPSEPSASEPRAGSLHKILTVCGNGVGTSLFLKNTLEQVLDRWGWSRFVTVEATDTISAKGKASEAVALLTSREIARILGDVGRPVKVVQDFTSTAEVDAVLRDTYDV